MSGFSSSPRGPRTAATRRRASSPWTTSLCWLLQSEGTGNVIGLAHALGVYVVTSGGLVPGRTHLDVGLAAIEGGAGAVQLRAPELEDTGILPLAADLAVQCRARGVLFVVNDR